MNLRVGSERGATAVEFALILPVLVMIFGGLLDVVGYFHVRGIVVDAASAGARAASVSADPADLQAIATAAVVDALAAHGRGALAPTVTVARDTTTSDVIEVSVTVDHTPLVGLVLTATSITVNSSVLYENPEGV